MIDLNENLLTLSQAARACPRRHNGRPIHVCTVYRWIARGLRGTRLEAIRVGGCLYTSREALQRFANRLTNELPSTTPTPPAERQKALQQVQRELDSAGI